MCKPPTPDQFHEMDADGKFYTIFDLVCKMAANINFARKWGPWAAGVFFISGLGTMAGRGIARDHRIEKVDAETLRIKQELVVKDVKDSMNNLSTQEKLDAILDELEIKYPRGHRR